MATFREKAGVLVSAIVVLSMVLLLFTLVVLNYYGAQVTPDPTLLATLTSMAGIALGYLIGKQSSQPNQAQTDMAVRESINRMENKP